jgi:hypothetical protein
MGSDRLLLPTPHVRMLVVMQLPQSLGAFLGAGSRRTVLLAGASAAKRRRWLFMGGQVTEATATLPG